MMKFNTVEQYKVFRYLENNFDTSYIEIKIINNNTLKVIDKANESMCFTYCNGKVIPIYK